MAKAEIAKKNNSGPTVRIFGDFVTRESMDSGPALVGLLYELVEEAKKKYGRNETLDTAGRLILDPDELSACSKRLARPILA